MRKKVERQEKETERETKRERGEEKCGGKKTPSFTRRKNEIAVVEPSDFYQMKIDSIENADPRLIPMTPPRISASRSLDAHDVG